jgi:hypothetical protein
MKASHAARVLALGLLTLAKVATACGYCVEDRIAAVYDYEMTKKAASRKYQLAYFAWDGPVTRNDAMRLKIIAMAESASGVEKGTARVSVEPASIAVMFDPGRILQQQLEAALRQKLAGLHILITPLQAPRSL